MAYVAPNGTIELYKNVDIDKDYRNTMYFADSSAQRTYFSGKTFTGSTFTNQMYTRVQENTVRVHAKADTIYGANYLGFKNETKWYYGFIIRATYINEQVTEIEYRIDEIQTWLFDIIWHNCFIERQHSTTDIAGDNLQPEPIDCSEHICCNMQNEVLQSASIGYVLALGTVTKSSNDPGDLYGCNTFNGIASTVKYLYFSTASDLVAFLNKAAFVDGVIEGLVNVGDYWCPLTLYVVPTGAFTLSGTTAHTRLGDFTVLSSSVKESNFSVNMPTYHGFGYSASLKYEPVNNKLFTYPYTYLEIETPLKSQEYKYETFSPTARKFKWYSVCNPYPSILIAPEMYNGVSNDYRYSMTIEDFPQLQIYSSGLWGAAGNALGSAIKVGASMLLAASTGVYADIAGVGDIASIPQSVLSIAEKGIKNVPNVNCVPSIKSTGGTSNLAPILANKAGQTGISNPIFSISANQWGLRKEYAMKIDEFFSKYGYAQNCVAFPNIHARTNWTYIKTKDCYIGGAIPADAKEIICNAMNEGITWWTGASTVGVYVTATGTNAGKPIANPTV